MGNPSALTPRLNGPANRTPAGQDSDKGSLDSSDTLLVQRAMQCNGAVPWCACEPAEVETGEAMERYRRRLGQSEAEKQDAKTSQSEIICARLHRIVGFEF